jgi:uncharacterized protein DUF3806
MEQKFEPPNPDDIADLEAKRAWVRDHYAEAARHKYETLDGKLRLLDTILRNKWIAPDETLNLQCLGVTFGDALAQRLSLTWVAVEDNLGRDLALVLDGTSVRVFPITSISKRIERGEEVEVYGLFEDACRTIEQLRREGT